MPDLPAPLTVTDQLLVALHSEVVGLRADLAAGGDRQVEPGRTLLSEPAAPPARNRTRTRLSS